MAEVVIPYKPRPGQLDLHNLDKRFMLTVCHRRWGKTVYEINKLLKACMTSSMEAPRYAYIAPYLKQAKVIAWDYLKHYSRPIPGISINESELRVDYPNGGRIRLFGADNPDALRGIYLDGVVLDEYAQIPPNLFEEVIFPALTDRRGWLDVVGTPKGRNHFNKLYEDKQSDPSWAVNIIKASDSGVFTDEELAEIKAAYTDMDLYEQEYECSWTAAVKGAYYADIINQIRDKGQVLSIPVEPAIPVNTFWDLGINDTTAIWFHQRVGMENRFIDYYECAGEGLEHYVRILRGKDYLYGDHYLPHDVEIRELTSGKSRKESLETMGIKPLHVVPRITAINEGIDMTRRVLPTCYFDVDRCDLGLRALENYRKDWDEKNQTFRSRPLHDWSSNGADALRQFAQGYRGASFGWNQIKDDNNPWARSSRLKKQTNVNWIV